MNRAKEYKKELKEHKKNESIAAVCEGLTQTQVEKLKALAENVQFTTEEEFSGKLTQLVEAYAPSTVKPAEKSVLEEGVEIEEVKSNKVSHDPLIDAAAKSISKNLVK
jgi:phage-related tail fiber protein